jgi:rhomboid protease GluP
MVGRQAAGYAVMLILFGLVMVQVDNWAHLGGFAGGYGIARWLDPLKPERVDHTMIALGLLAASLLSILASIVFGLPMIRTS